MSDKPAPKKWNDMFCRVTNLDEETPRFSLKGAKSYLYEYDGYSGGHEGLDGIMKLLGEKGIKCHVSGTDSPLNVASFEYRYDFEDGGLEIYSGNYFFGPPGHGAFVVGFKAFRWLLEQLGMKQPRKFKNEIETDAEPPPAAVAGVEAATLLSPPADPQANAILAYLNQRGYQVASFDRLRRQIDSSITDEQFNQIILRNGTLFRRATIRGGKPGIGKRVP
jgi:hypothetical protein